MVVTQFTGGAGGGNGHFERIRIQPGLATDLRPARWWLGLGRSSQVTYPHVLQRNIVTVPPVRGLNISVTTTSLPARHRSQLGKEAAVFSIPVMAALSN